MGILAHIELMWGILNTPPSWEVLAALPRHRGMVPRKPRLAWSRYVQGMSEQRDQLPLVEWLTSLQSCCSSSLQGHGNQGRSSVTGERQMSHSSSVTSKRTSWGATGWSPSCWENHGVCFLGAHFQKKKVAGSSWHGLTKGKSCLTNLPASHNEMDRFVGKRRAAGTIYFNVSKAFNSMSCNVLASK